MKLGIMPLAFGLSVVVVAGAAFTLGKQAGSKSPEVESRTGAGEAKEPEEAGVIRFEPESLELANIQVRPVDYHAVAGELPVTGTVEPNLGGVVRVTPRVAGKVMSVSANLGDNVRAGQPLVLMSSTELATAQAAYRQARARAEVASGNLARQRQLAGTGEFGRHKVEEARVQAVSAQGELNDAEKELAGARNQILEARSEKAASTSEAAAAESDVAEAQSEAASTQSEITEAQGQVRALRAALAQAETQVEVTQSRFNRMDNLLKKELVSRQDWEQAQADLKRARSDVESAHANISQGEAKVETARAHQRAAEAKVKTMQAKVRAQRERVDQAAAKIDTLTAREAQLLARVSTARQQLEIATAALKREEKVYKGGFFTTQEIVNAEAALRQAGAEQRAAADQVRLLGGVPDGGNTLTVTAPMAGRVTERSVTLGETVSPERALFTVVNLRSVWVQLAVYSKDLPRVRLGQRVAIRTDTAPGRTFEGTVSYVGDLVDETTRTVKVRCAIGSAGGVLKPQTFVRGSIRTEVREQVLALPNDAVQEVGAEKVVFLKGDRPGEFRQQAVETGDTEGDQTIIRSGLKPGDLVVTRGAFLIKAQAMKSELTEE